jgi:thymidylate synthase (FAD)
MLTIELLTHTPDPLKVIAAAARRCYSDDDITSLFQYDMREHLIRNLVKWGHLSVLEHVSFTFHISGMSRAASQQLLRHRHPSVSQQSQRYVEGFPDVVKPDAVLMNPAASDTWDRVVRDSKYAYNDLISHGIPAEDARGIVPMNSATQIVWTANARSLLEIIRLRTCKQAQQEIRRFALCVLSNVEHILPAVFNKCKPDCASCERKHTDCI